MMKTKEYRSFINQLSRDKKKDKSIRKKINEIRKQYGMSEYSFHNDVKKMQQHFSDNIDAFTAQKIASYLWKAYDKFFYGNGKSIHYKKYGTQNYLEGKSNKTGIHFKNGMLLWKNLKIPVMIDSDNPYEYQFIQSDISYCRVIRKYVRNKYKYYVQIIFKGNPPVKVDLKTGEKKHCMGRAS